MIHGVLNPRAVVIPVREDAAGAQGGCGEPGGAPFRQAGALLGEGQYPAYLEPHQGQESLHNEA